MTLASWFVGDACTGLVTWLTKGWWRLWVGGFAATLYPKPSLFCALLIVIKVWTESTTLDPRHVSKPVNGLISLNLLNMRVIGAIHRLLGLFIAVVGLVTIVRQSDSSMFGSLIVFRRVRHFDVLLRWFVSPPSASL